MLKKKNKVFLKKKIDKLNKKNKINFRLNHQLEYIHIFEALSKSSILIFFQFLSLNGQSDNNFFRILFDKGVSYLYIKKQYCKHFFCKKMFTYIENFNNLLLINNLLKIKDLKLFFTKTNVLISGYYFNNIFFCKKDLKLKNIQKEELVRKFIKFKILINKIFIKIILLLKYYLKTTIWLQ